MNQKLIDLCWKKRRGEISTSWDYIAAQNGYTSGEKLRLSFKSWRRKNERESGKTYDNIELVGNSDELEIKKRELYKERQKLFDVANEYRQMQREESREERFYERLDQSIKSLCPVDIPKHEIQLSQSNRAVICSIADAHFGEEFELKDFSGGIINKYNTQIFKDRMWEYKNKIIKFCEDRNINHIYITELGDAVSGVLHISQIKSNQIGVIDQVIEYAEFMRHWLNDLSKYLKIDVYFTEGNHSNLRLLTGKKGDFPHENTERIVSYIVKSTLENNPNITVHHGENGVNYFSVSGFNVISLHGDKEKNIENSLDKYTRNYRINPHFLLCGHMHSSKSLNIGIDRFVLQCPCFAGTNEYALNEVGKTSNAGAKLFVIEEDYGLVSEEYIWFK